MVFGTISRTVRLELKSQQPGATTIRRRDQTALSIFTFIKYYTVKIFILFSHSEKKPISKKKVIHLILGIKKKKIHIGLQLLMVLQFCIVVVVVVVSLVSVVGSSD